MSRNIILYLTDILDSITLILKYAENIDKKQFESNEMLQDAIFRRFEIIGESSKKIPKNIRDKYNEIPWRQMSDLRNILIHEYFGVNLDMVWNIIEKELSNLAFNIKKIIEDIKNN